MDEFGSKEMSEVSFDDMEQTSILGIKWQPNTDHYSFKVNKGDKIEKLTKRKIFSKIGQLFDPNGYVAPAMIVGRILMQDIWSAKLE